MIKPNLLFLTIDSLYSDRIYGLNKTSKTPHIDFLIKNGINFTQAVSTSDATGLSLGSIFTASYPFKTGITHFYYDPQAPNYFDLLKKNGYNLYATVPDVSFFMKLTANFTDKDTYVYDKRDSWVQLVGGIGQLIIDRFEKKMKEPWIYFIHLMDLHSPFYLPKEFDYENYGKTRYDRMVSAIDFWIGKFLEKIDLKNTLVILSSDHGDYIPIIEEEPKRQTRTQTVLRKGKEILPQLEPIGLKVYTTFHSIKRSLKLARLKKSLTEGELRTLDSRGQWNLYDELIRVPLIFSGYGIHSTKIISDQVRHVDIFPTIIDILKLQDLLANIDGRSLLSLLQGSKFDDVPAYIETGSRDPKKLGNIIGIRTRHFKYLRSRSNPTQNVSLFDLQNDPEEKNNIAQTNQEIVKEMEKILNDIRKDSIREEIKELTDDETKKIKEELKKLGYI